MARPWRWLRAIRGLKDNNVLKQTIFAGALFGLTTLAAPAAFAQADIPPPPDSGLEEAPQSLAPSQDNCTDAIVALTHEIISREGRTANDRALDNARNQTRRAQSALDRGNYERCMQLTNNARETLPGN